MKIIYILILLLISTLPAYAEFTVFTEISQRFITSWGNDFIEDTKEQISPMFTDIFINISAESESGKIASTIQVATHQFGDYDNMKPHIEMGFLRWYLHSDLLFFEVGMVKPQYGLYSETLRMASTHEYIVSPLQFEFLASLYHAFRGAAVRGTYQYDKYLLSYSFVAGHTDIKTDSRTAALMSDKYQLTDIKSKGNFTANFSLIGKYFRLAYSRVKLEHFLGLENTNLQAHGFINYLINADAYSFEIYPMQKLMIGAELYYDRTQSKGSVISPITIFPTYFFKDDWSWYGKFYYQFHTQIGIGGYAARFNKSSNATRYFRSISTYIVYQPYDNFLVKVQTIFLEGSGYSNMDRSWFYEPKAFKKHWGMGAIEFSYQF